MLRIQSNTQSDKPTDPQRKLLQSNTSTDIYVWVWVWLNPITWERVSDFVFSNLLYPELLHTICLNMFLRGSRYAVNALCTQQKIFNISFHTRISISTWLHLFRHTTIASVQNWIHALRQFIKVANVKWGQMSHIQRQNFRTLTSTFSHEYSGSTIFGFLPTQPIHKYW